NGKPQEWVIPDVHYIVLKRLLKKSMQATLEKVVGEIKQSVQFCSCWYRNFYQAQVPISIGTEIKKASGINLELFWEHGTVHRKKQASPFKDQNQTDRGSDHAWERPNQKEKKAVGRIHLKKSVKYWKEVLKPASLIISWLEDK
ncbi:6341_t:CDS:2, partial [Gigaspora rosea]